MNPTDRPGPLQGRNGVTPAVQAPHRPSQFEVRVGIELAQVETQLRAQEIGLENPMRTDRERATIADVCRALTERADLLRTWLAWEQQVTA